MVSHCSTLAWKMPWTEEPGGLQSTGSRRVGHDSETKRQRQSASKLVGRQAPKGSRAGSQPAHPSRGCSCLCHTRWSWSLWQTLCGLQTLKCLPPGCLQEPSDTWDQSSSLQSLCRVRLFATPWTAARQASLSITSSRSLLKLMSVQSVMPSNHLILCRPLLLPPSIFPSIRVFSNESVLHIRWPKYWSFSFSISPSNEYSGLISFRMDWLDQESSPTP